MGDPLFILNQNLKFCNERLETFKKPFFLLFSKVSNLSLYISKLNLKSTGGIIYKKSRAISLFQSLEMNNAIFEENWLNSSAAFKKYLILIMTRSQKPFQIKVGFFEVSLEILNTVNLFINSCVPIWNWISISYRKHMKYRFLHTILKYIFNIPFRYEIPIFCTWKIKFGMLKRYLRIVCKDLYFILFSVWNTNSILFGYIIEFIYFTVFISDSQLYSFLHRFALLFKELCLILKY
jgi:hypothetical protein